MGSANSTAGVVVTPEMLNAADSQDLVVLENGDLLDQEGDDLKEESQEGHHLAVAPAVIFQAYEQGQQGYTTRFDIEKPETWVLGRWLKDDGTAASPGSVALATCVENGERSGSLVDLAKSAPDRASQRPWEISAPLINWLLNLPGSKQAFEANFALASALRQGRKGDVTSIAISMTVSATLGQHANVIIIGGDKWNELNRVLKIKPGWSRFGVSPAARALNKRN